MKPLFDTNILLDLCNDKRAPFHKQCVDLLMEAVAQPNIEIMAPVSSLNDVYYVFASIMARSGRRETISVD